MTVSLTVWFVLFIINFIFGIRDLKNKASGWSPSLTWFATGISFQGIIFELAKLIV